MHFSFKQHCPICFSPLLTMKCPQQTTLPKVIGLATVGNNPQFLMMDVPGATATLRNNILRFIVHNCCIKWTMKDNKAIVVKDAVSGSSRLNDDPIVLDSLFKKAIGKAADDPSNLDNYCFQTNPM